MRDLTDFLARLAGEPFAFGRTDCALALADWWHVRHGVDPAAHLRGSYADLETCGAVLVRERGLLRLVWMMARRIGARRTVDPAPGDFAVVRYKGGHFGAIMAPSGKWAIKASNGLLMTRTCRVVAAWEIG